MLPDGLQSEVEVVRRTDPFGGIDDPALRGRHDLPAGQRDRGHAHLLEDLAGDARRRAVLHLLEVGRRVDGVLEPAERVGSHRLDEDRLDVHLQDVPVELAIEVVAAALEDPRHVRQLVEADAGARHRIGEKARRGVLARPVVGPCIPAFDDALVDRIEDLESRHDGAVGQHFHLDAAGGHLVDAVGHSLEQLEIDAGRRHGGLHAYAHGRLRLRQRGPGAQREQRGGGDDSSQQ